METKINKDELQPEILEILEYQPKEYTQEELQERKQRLTLMSDRLFEVVFANNKNNEIIEEIINAVRKIHELPKIPQVENIIVQKATLDDLLGRKMTADLVGYSESLNITVEVQREKQEAFAVRAILSSSNVMKKGFEIGQGYFQAPDVIGLNILGFRLPELEQETSFCSRIVRANYDTGKLFLADKYSEYFIEMPKLPKTIQEVSEEYRNLWEICVVLKSQAKNYGEVMKTMSSAVAKELIKEAQEALENEHTLKDILSYEDKIKKIAETLAEKKAEGEAKGKASEAIKIAKNLLKEGVSIELIKRVTDLDEGTIKRLQ